MGPVLDAIIDAAKKTPLVVEAYDCHACGADGWLVHEFEESFPCARCGVFMASKAPIYNQEENNG